MPRAVELDLDMGASAVEMANEIFGDGVTVDSATYYGDNDSSGIYSGADTTSAGVAPSDSGVILSTGHADDFTNGNNRFNTNRSTSKTTNTSGEDNNADFNALAGGSTYDASYLEVNFYATGDTLTIDFVLASEEYPEFLSYNDTIGVWVNGEAAEISIGDGTATIGNINDANENIYIDNTNDQYNTEMDGFTITLTFVAPVSTTGLNTLVVGVTDAGDSSYDTNLLIAGGSVQTAIVALDDAVNLTQNGSETIDVVDNDTTSAPGGTLTITHINEIAVSAGSTVVLLTGQGITLNIDGTLTIDADNDTETVYFNYTIEDSSGATDSALVEIVQSPPCFTPDTLILTEFGELPVQDLRPGMLVKTKDRGLQPLIWVGKSVLPARSDTYPIKIDAGFLENDRALIVSPQHRILLRGVFAELLFGVDEVLVKAKDLVNDQTVTRCFGNDQIVYFHLLLEEHELLLSNGQWSESFLPGPNTIHSFDPDAAACLHATLGKHHHINIEQSVRPSLRSYEARALAAA
ncbi:MAG: choice-of-anchor L domain-containing protein [Paracoccaceae bacterium]|nr:choice-of-anchor L domain-containing protein [Paracoccaceae bacterium]